VNEHGPGRKGLQPLVGSVLVMLALLAMSGCAAAVDSTPLGPSAPVATAPRATGTAGPSPAGISLTASMDGTIECAVFPNSCIAVLSVLPAGTIVSPEWRPPSSDPYWGPVWDSERPVHLDSKVTGSLPRLSTGNYVAVVSLLAGNDTPSYGPDGLPVMWLLGRCQRAFSVVPITRSVTLTITPRQTGSLDGDCSVQASIDPA
jgi:hypothetical protein